MKTLLFTSLLFIKFALLPNTQLLFWMGIAIGVDFLTGFTKAIILHEARTSSGLRKTITKFLQYGGALAVGVILSHAAEQNKMDAAQKLLGYYNDGLVLFIIYTEVTSIFENLIACDSTSPIARYLFVPAHKILTVQIRNNPVVKAAEGVQLTIDIPTANEQKTNP